MVQLHDKTFEPYISEKEIQQIVSDVASKMSVLKDAKPLFIVILKGSFIFASDLVKALDYDVELCFMQLKSYEGTQSSGKIKDLMGIPPHIKGRTVVVLEDIIDTGSTLEYLNQQLLEEQPHKIYYASLLLKPSVYKKDIPINFVGKEIPNEFVVGYGLDYDELGRTLTQIYKLKNT
jgi:adenylate kinase